MKRSVFLFALLTIMLLSTSCKTGQTAIENDHISNLMSHSEEYPQLTRAEFIEITNNYLGTGNWDLPYEKAAFHTSGTNFSAYIIDSEFLFSLSLSASDEAENTFWLSYFNNGKETAVENDPSLFEDFFIQNQ